MEMPVVRGLTVMCLEWKRDHVSLGTGVEKRKKWRRDVSLDRFYAGTGGLNALVL